MKHIHFIGIGGISMSGIACMLKEQGYEVSGSDRSENDCTRMLEDMGIPVKIGQVASNITPDIDTVVYTAAIHEDNPELMAARALCPQVLTRAEMLGEMFDSSETPIAVAGSHGKTSTSSMLAHIYMAAGRDPSFNIGGVLHNTGTNYRTGAGDAMIIEACEYTDSFLHFHAKYNIITNIDPEHLDYFKTFDNEKHHFQMYVDGMKEGGVLITSPALRPLFDFLLKDRNISIQTVSLEEPADFTASNIEHHTDALGYQSIVERTSEPWICIFPVCTWFMTRSVPRPWRCVKGFPSRMSGPDWPPIRAPKSVSNSWACTTERGSLMIMPIIPPKSGLSSPPAPKFPTGSSIWSSSPTPTAAPSPSMTILWRLCPWLIMLFSATSTPPVRWTRERFPPPCWPILSSRRAWMLCTFPCSKISKKSLKKRYPQEIC